MYVNRERLKELIYNVLLWTPGKGDAKKSVSGGKVEITLHNDISFLSTDGYVAVQTGVAFGGGVRGEVSGEDLKDILKAITLLEEEEVEVSVDGATSTVFFGKANTNFFEHDPSELWNTIRMLVDPRNHSSVDIARHFSAFYLDPKRLSKFSLLEPKLEYPLALAPSTSDVTDQPTILWKYGSDVRGVVAPLTPELLMEAYPDDLDEVMW